MSKAGAIAALGVGGSGTAITTAYLSGAFGGNYDMELYSTLEDFNSKDKEVEGCVLSLFPGLKNKTEDTNLTEPNGSTAIGDNFFTGNEQISSCLVVNWKKDEETSGNDKKWKGDFRFLWAVKQDEKNKGFVTFATATTTGDETNKKLNWKGTIYEVGRDNANAEWQKKNKKDITKDQTIETSYSKFPKANSGLAEMNNKSFWGLVDAIDSSKICKATSECSGDLSTSSFQGYWKWTSDSAKNKLEDWTVNLNDWWTDLFGTDKWDMAKVVKDKTGTWVNRGVKNESSTAKPAVT